LVQLCFIKKNGKRRYKYLVLEKGQNLFCEENILILPKCSLKLISSTCSSFWLTIFLFYLVDVDIPMGANCASLLTNLFLYSYEADFMQGFLKKKENKLTRSFNFTFRYIYDVLSLNNPRFGDFRNRIYPIELEIQGYHRYR
jgi:hypothetical protein